MSPCRCHSDLNGHGITIELIDGRREILLITIKLYRLSLPPRGVLDMNESPHLIIVYLLRNEQKNLKSKSYD